MTFAEHNLAKINQRFLRSTGDCVMSRNERIVLDVIRRHEEISCANITRLTNLTAQSVSRIVSSLLQRGFLIKGKAVVQGRGQPSRLIRIFPEAVHTFGISIMTDAVSGSIMNFSGKILELRTVPLSDPSLDGVLTTIEDLIGILRQEHNIKDESIFGVGVGITGYFTGKRLQINPPYPLKALAFCDIDIILSNHLHLPVWLDNDGNAAALAENMVGAGLKYDTFGYIYFSKGLGGGLVVNGNVVRGGHGNAGEFAGILSGEDYEYRPTIELLRREVNKHGKTFSDLNEFLLSFDVNWPGVEEWMELIKPRFQQIINSLTAVLDPEVIILGGRIPITLAEKLCDIVRFESIKRRGISIPVPIVIPSAISGDATAIGAAAGPFKSQFFL